MKIGTLAFLLIISHAMASTTPSSILEYKMERRNVKALDVGGADIKVCSLCVQFAGQFINELLNIVLNAGVVGGCSELCALLKQNNVIIEVCDILCDIVGIEEFIKIIEKADLDPIYYCELLTACPIKDDGDANITSLVVAPRTVAKGGQLMINLAFTTKNGTGTGETSLLIQTVDGIPIGDSQLQAPMDPGSYTGEWKVSVAPDPDCDPSQGPCEEWLPGNYTVNVAICNGECGSKHPHSQIYDTATTTFQVSGRRH